MAIVHLAAKRLQGVKGDRVVDSLGSDADGVNTGIALIAGSSIKQSLGSHTGNNGGNYYRTGYKALGSTLSTNWVLRFRYKPTATDADNAGNRDGDAMGIFVMDGQYKDNVNDTQVDSRKGIGYAFRSQNSNTTWYYSAYQGTSNASTSGMMHHGSGHTNFSDQATVGEEYYVEIIKNGTTVTVTQRVGSHSASVTETETISSSLSGFTHINIVSFDGNGGTQPVVEAEIRDIELWDDTTSASGTATWSGIDNFTHQTGTTYESPKLGTGAYSFDGSGDQVIFGSASDWAFLNSGEDFSLAFWCKPTATNASQQLFATMSDSSGANKGFGVSITSANKINISVYPSAGGGYPFAHDVGTSVFEAGVWHHYTLVYTKSDGKMRIYKDGSEIVEQAKGGTFTSGTPQFALMTGQRGDGGDRDYNGKLDDIGIWSRALSTTEISDLVNNTADTPTVSDDLATDKGWVSNSSGMVYNATNDSVDLNSLTRSTTSQEMYIDLQDSDYLNGSNLSDTSFVVRFGKIRWNAIATQNITANIMLSKSLQDSGTNQYSLNLQMFLNSSERITRARANSGTHNEGNSTDVESFSLTYTPSTSNIYRWEIVRSGNDFTFKVYAENDSSYSTPLETKTVTASGITALRYILITNDSEQNQSQTADMEILGDIEIYNGTTSTSSPAGALVSSLSDKANLKANYTMDSAIINDLSGETPNKSDDFSGTDDWIDRNTNIAVSTSDDRINYNVGTQGSGNDATYYDLGAGNVSDTKWTLTWTQKIQNHSSNSASSCHLGVGLTNGGADMTTFAYNDSQDSIVFATGVGNSDTKYYNHHSDSGNSLDAGSFRHYLTRTPSAGHLNYMVLVRESATKFVSYTYADASRTTLLEKKESTISGNPQNLRYIAVQSRMQNHNTFDGYIDDVKFYNNVVFGDGCKNDYSSTSALDAMTNLPVNTIFEQIDDTPTYWWKQSDNTWALDGTTQKSVGMTASDWSFAGKQSSDQTQSIDNGVKWVSSASQSGGAPVAVYDFGSALSDTWVARFSWHGTGSYSTQGGNAYIAVALSSQGTYGSSTSMNSALSGSDKSVFNLWHLGNSSSDRNLRVKRYNSGFAEGSSSGANTVAWEDDTTMYFEMSYDGTTLSCRRKTDSTYSTNHADVTPTLTNTGLTGLRYLLFGGTDTDPNGVFTITLKDFSLLEGRTTWL